jgi:transposase
LPIGIVITPGQAHDVTAVPALMHEIDCDPEQMLGDKGYDSEAVREDIEQRGGEAVIPSIATRKIQHAVDKALYALRSRIERFFNRAKNSRRVATRYDKLIESFAAFVLLASIRVWIKFKTSLSASHVPRSSRLISRPHLIGERSAEFQGRTWVGFAGDVRYWSAGLEPLQQYKGERRMDLSPRGKPTRKGPCSIRPPTHTVPESPASQRGFRFCKP